MADKKTQQSVAKLAADLPGLGEKMQVFSLSMRSLYVEEKVSANIENGEEFIRLRDDTRNDAVTYMRGIMPLNEICVLKLQEYFSYYECLKFEDWKECAPDILEEVAAYREASQILVKLHQAFLVNLKTRKDKATVLCDKFGKLKVEYDKAISEL